MCDWAPTHWCMCVKVFLEVVTLDISTPLAVALDGGVTVFPTTTVVHFFPEVCHRVAHHRCATLRRRARIRQHWRCMHHRWHARR
jgi:hypothetical protein